MAFLDDLRANHSLFLKAEKGKHLTAEERKTFDAIKERYNLSPLGTVPTQEALAEFFGVTRYTIIRWKKGGMPVEDDGSYDPFRIASWRDLIKPPPGNTAKATIEDEDENGNKIDWEEEYRKYKALLAEIALKKAKGEIIEISKVEELLTSRAIEFKRALFERTRRLSLELANKDARDIQAILDDDVRSFLEIYTRPHGLATPPAICFDENAKDGTSADKTSDIP